MSDVILRHLARDQWVRIHGTPRVTVLVGRDRATAMWRRWLEVAHLEGALLEGALATTVQDAISRATAAPAAPIAVRCTSEELRAWRTGRADRAAAMVDEGVVEIPDETRPRASPRRPRVPARRRTRLFDARSAAEAALFEALEANPPTAGRFELNGYLAVRFGSHATEVDLLARRDRIAIEIDGYHHFTDLDAYRRDRRKDLLLQIHGLTVIRVLAEDVIRDARPAVAAVHQALAARM